MISVVLATYNGEPFIYEQLKSIKEQTLKPDEVIISDDCSSDKTVEIIQQFIRENQLKYWKLIVNRKNIGFQKNFMNLIDTAQGEIVFLADQDDIWLLNKISHMYSILQRNPHIWSLSCAYQYIDAKGNKIHSKDHNERNSKQVHNVSFKAFLDDGSYPGMSLAIRKECINYMNYVKNMDLLAHDWAINIICSALGKMYFCDETLVLYRQHGKNTIGATVKPTHEFRGKRCILLDKRIEHYEQAIKLLKSVPNIPKEKLNFVEKKWDLYVKRKKYLEANSLFNIIALIRYVKYYPSFKTYIGDVLSGFLDHLSV